MGEVRACKYAVGDWVWWGSVAVGGEYYKVCKIEQTSFKHVTVYKICDENGMYLLDSRQDLRKVSHLEISLQGFKID